MMPHPERVFRNLQFSYYPRGLSETSSEFSPWMQLWRNARVYLN
jgi:phosphoribosylformylglycinamidine synthase